MQLYHLFPACLLVVAAVFLQNTPTSTAISATTSESERAARATILERHKKVKPARQKFVDSLRGGPPQPPKASARITEAEKNQLPIMKKLNLVREWLVHDGKLETKPTGNIGWIALAVLFYLLSPILIPLFLSPVIVLLAFFVFLPIIIDNDGYA